MHKGQVHTHTDTKWTHSPTYMDTDNLNTTAPLRQDRTNQTQPSLRPLDQAMAVRVHGRGFAYGAERADIEAFLNQEIGWVALEKVVVKGAYHPYSNNRCSVFCWVKKSWVELWKCGQYTARFQNRTIQFTLDKGPAKRPPDWLLPKMQELAETRLQIECFTLNSLWWDWLWNHFRQIHFKFTLYLFTLESL